MLEAVMLYGRLSTKYMKHRATERKTNRDRTPPPRPATLGPADATGCRQGARAARAPRWCRAAPGRGGFRFRVLHAPVAGGGVRDCAFRVSYGGS